MAATTRATSTEPFPPLDQTPRTPTSLVNVSSTTAPREKTTSPKLDKLRSSPVPLTGVAVLAELKKKQQQQQQQKVAEQAIQSSPNPAAQAVQSLMSGGGMSRPSDAPSSTRLSRPLERVPEGTPQEHFHASPISMSAFGTFGSTAQSPAMTATANDGSSAVQQFVAEPAQMSEGAPLDSGNGGLQVHDDQEGPKALSYPGPPPHEQSQEEGPARGMSLPGYGQGSPKSPPTNSNKRHKCPYCETDFTRHHNLKSHLLTHSQEKPYVCQTCQARFRRLHDLKRHTKLHTGERPHICEKCGRKFARGDALARHNKGPGGCAGRRSSFGGEDDFGDGGDNMNGIEYEDDGSSPDQGRRGSEPSRKRTHLEAHDDPNRQIYRQYSNTYPPPYPPAAQEPSRGQSGSVGSMGPPQVVLPGSHATSSPRDMSMGGTSMSSSYFSNQGHVLPQQGGMIESPKPISPGQPAQDQHRLSVGDASVSSAHRNRSPSLTTQFQQAHFGRGSGGRTPPQPPPQFQGHHTSQAPVLPPLSSQRSGLQSSVLASASGPGPSMLHHQQLPPGDGGRSSVNSIRDALGGPDPNDLWGYVRSLEQRFSRMQDEYELRISRLQEEVISLKGQVSNATSYSSDMGRAGY